MKALLLVALAWAAFTVASGCRSSPDHDRQFESHHVSVLQHTFISQLRRKFCDVGLQMSTIFRGQNRQSLHTRDRQPPQHQRATPGTGKGKLEKFR